MNTGFSSAHHQRNANHPGPRTAATLPGHGVEGAGASGHEGRDARGCRHHANGGDQLVNELRAMPQQHDPGNHAQRLHEQQQARQMMRGNPHPPGVGGFAPSSAGGGDAGSSERAVPMMGAAMAAAPAWEFQDRANLIAQLNEQSGTVTNLRHALARKDKEMFNLKQALQGSQQQIQIQMSNGDFVDKARRLSGTHLELAAERDKFKYVVLFVPYRRGGGESRWHPRKCPWAPISASLCLTFSFSNTHTRIHIRGNTTTKNTNLTPTTMIPVWSTVSTSRRQG